MYPKTGINFPMKDQPSKNFNSMGNTRFSNEFKQFKTGNGISVHYGNSKRIDKKNLKGHATTLYDQEKMS